jgi:signal transduction histidine kinase
METQANIIGAKPAADAVSVLLVDDEKRNLDVLESILGPLGLRHICATTPEEALLALVHEDFACIVLDIHLPGMSGLELARLIKTRKRSQCIPIIFLTAYFLEEKDILQGYGAGAVDYLTKPINPHILKSKVGVFVDLFRTARALGAANGALEMVIAQRRAAEETLRNYNLELEARVQDRVQDLKRAHDELLAASRAKDDFLAMLSHELRTPLNPILLIASEAANDRELPPRVRTDFDTIRKNVEVEARLIDDLLDLTRITRGKIILEKRLLNVHEILEDAIATLREELDAKQLSLNLKLVAAKQTVFADALRVHQIFLNLLKNAVKFTPVGGQIRVDSSVAEDRLVIRVADTGIGMLPEEIAAIFTPFSQGNHAGNGGTQRFGGLGLGLAISQRLAEVHSGSIHAESGGRDPGSIFSVELPLAQQAEENEHALDQPPEPLPAAPAEGRGLRVLLVEDHEPTRTALTHLLLRRRYKVTPAASLAEARTLASTQQFSVLISDIGLPDGNGCDLMAEFRARFDLEGIALTGYGMEQDVARSQQAGFRAHLTKPVRVASLDQALAAILHGRAC